MDVSPRLDVQCPKVAFWYRECKNLTLGSDTFDKFLSSLRKSSEMDLVFGIFPNMKLVLLSNCTRSVLSNSHLL
jgi:hypothetical protein